MATWREAYRVADAVRVRRACSSPVLFIASALADELA